MSSSANCCYIPFFGWAMGRLDMIHIDRSKRAEAWAKVAEQGKRAACSSGHWVIMFPEGTRTPRGSQGAYKAGASRLADRHRRADRADCRHVGALLAAQEPRCCGPG